MQRLDWVSDAVSSGVYIQVHPGNQCNDVEVECQVGVRDWE